jgi:UPF0176 protein
MPEYQVLLFYKYIHIPDPKALAEEQLALQKALGFRGRSIVASEGVNMTFEGTRENTEKYIELMQKDPRFQDVHFKKSPGTGTAFPKLHIKVRSEIVTLGLGKCDIDPNQVTGKRLEPAELHKWFLDGKEFYIVDMRNAYEHEVGHFQGSLLPPMDNFRDLPKFLKSIAHLKNKTVLTVCTGGVRCEKASGYLVENGFTDVYQLQGGIVSYMEKYPNENFLGKLYVFDNRMLMGFFTDDPKHQILGKCLFCSKPSERFTNCADIKCHRQLIACEECEKRLGKRLLCKEKCKSKSSESLYSRLYRSLRKTLFKLSK